MNTTSYLCIKLGNMAGMEDSDFYGGSLQPSPEEESLEEEKTSTSISFHNPSPSLTGGASLEDQRI